MAKYKYTMKVRKVIYMSEEMIEVIAENEKEAKKLARIEAQKNPNIFEVESNHYDTEVYCYSANPVSDDKLSHKKTAVHYL